MPKYQVNVLPDKEFFKVAKSNPKYEYVDETNLGFADPETGKAYVRFSNWTDLMKGTALHELEHLVEKDCPIADAHCDANGVRHKKFKDFARKYLAPTLSTLGFLTPLGPLGAVAGGAIGGGISGAANARHVEGVSSGPFSSAVLGGIGKGALTGGLTAAGGTALKGLGALGGAGGSSATTSPLGKFTNLLTSPFKAVGRGLKTIEGRLGDPFTTTRPSLMQQIAGQGAEASAKGIGSTGLSTFGIPKVSGALGGQTIDTILAGGGGGGGGGGPVAGNFLSKILGGGGGQRGGMNPFLASAGLLGIGQFGKQAPEVPDLSNLPSVRRLQSETDLMRQGKSSSPLTQSAMNTIQGRLNSPFGGADPAILQQVNDSYNNLVKQYTSQYKLARPNADIATDTQFRLGMEEIERRRAQDLADVQQEEKRRYEDLQTQSISDSLGIDRDTLQNLSQLAQLDVDEISLQLGIDAADAAAFKEQFGGLASLFALKGLYPNLYGGGA